jgi:hypothetical protein
MSVSKVYTKITTNLFRGIHQLVTNLQFWKDYEEHEQEFLDITTTIPLIKEHLLKPWSPRLRTLMSKLYNSFEDIFREMIAYQEYDDTRKKVKRKRKDIHYYREILEPVHNLSYKRVIVNAESINEIFPFLKFAISEVPDWWSAINKVRHEWSLNRRKANLKNTLEAMSGLFLMNILNKNCRMELVKMRVIKSDDRIPTSTDIRQWKQILISLKDGYSGWKFKAETHFFLLQFPLGHELKEYFGI